MQIGLRDTVVPSGKREAGEVLQAAVRVALRIWRDAVMQDGETDTVYPSVLEVPWVSITSLLVFRNEESRRRCAEEGVTPDTEQDVIQLLFDAGRLTVVHAEGSRLVAPIRGMIESLQLI